MHQSHGVNQRVRTNTGPIKIESFPAHLVLQISTEDVPLVCDPHMFVTNLHPVVGIIIVVIDVSVVFTEYVTVHVVVINVFMVVNVKIVLVYVVVAGVIALHVMVVV